MFAFKIIITVMQFQSGYCFINGTCIQSGTLKSNDSCWRCLALSNAFDWTWGMYGPYMYNVSLLKHIQIV